LRTSPIVSTLSFTCAALIVALVAFAARVEDAAAKDAAPVAKIPIHYLTKEYEEPVPLSLVDTRPREAKFKAGGSEVWVSSEVGGIIAVIDTSNWTVKKKIGFSVPGVRPELLQPVGMEFTKDGKHLFVR